MPVTCASLLLSLARCTTRGKLVSKQRGVAQSAYQIQVTDTSGVLWETGKVLSHQSIHVPYEGSVLSSGQRCTWRVRVWDGNDQPSTWSEPAWWEMGLLHTSDWQAHWIEPGWQEDPNAQRPCPYLRTTFSVDGPVSSARAYITSLGLYELFLNGQRVGDAYFTPGYTSYNRRLQYQTYDITALLQEDENAIGVILGDGWYRGKLGSDPSGSRNTYGERLALLVQLHIRYADGHEQLVLSDEGWKATTGPLLSSDLQEGEVYDARLEMPCWNKAGFDAGQWQKVEAVSYPKNHLVATNGPLVGPHEVITPIALRKQAKKQPWIRRIIPLSWIKREKRRYEQYIWDTGFHFGEWLEPDEGLFGLKMVIGILKRMLFSAPLVATAYFANSTRLLAQTACVLGKDDDAREYEALHRRIKEAYCAVSIHQDGQIRPEKQASYVRALAFDLVPPTLQRAAVDHLVRLIQEKDYHLGTGFLSTPYLCHVLSENGQLDVAYALLKQDTIPSWLYEVKKGATTIWEVWDGIGEDGTPNGSLNHYAKGAVGSWLYQVVAGIEPGAPGYKHIRFQPRPSGGLSAASARYHFLYGEIASNWQMRDGRFALTIRVPANTTATVYLPAAEARQVMESGQVVESAEGVIRVSQEQETTVIEVGSGTYDFAYPLYRNNE